MSTPRGKRYGQAGSGLGSDASIGKFGRENARVGASGERYFSRLLASNAKTRSYPQWNSLRIPSKPGQRKYSGDVDIAVASGKRLLLVDIKRWSAKGIYWTFFNMPMRNLSPMSKALSKNMDLARSRYRESLPGHDVQSIVVFVPNHYGQLPWSVLGLIWPGFIRSYQAQSGVSKIARFLGSPEEPSRDLQALCGRMTK